MDSQKQQILERLKQANNILITVSANPSVDQLSACLGLTIMLDELGKHATAVFSGTVPPAIEFLQPEKTIEKNTDSLRDFIIALDKAKADKLRYKVEDTVVKIFITPYRTSIGEKDLEFSQGDFNVEAVVALGVHDQKDLDQAITSHGRILHDATVISINTTVGDNLGTINWQDPKASSLSEMVAGLAENFDKKVVDNQVATALLTGIVAETDRFSNAKTSPETMRSSAMLMAAGANQQLVATKLQQSSSLPAAVPAAVAAGAEPVALPPQEAKPGNGTLQIEHAEEAKPDTVPPQKNEEAKSEEKPETPPVEPEAVPEPEEEAPQIHIDEQGQLHKLNDNREFLSGPGPAADGAALDGMASEDEEKPSGAPMMTEGSKFVFDPPTLGGTLTANSRPEGLEPTTDPLSSSSPADQPILKRDNPSVSTGLPIIEPPKGEEIPKPSIPDTSDTTPKAPQEEKTITPPTITLPEPKTTDIQPPAPLVLPGEDQSILSPTPVSMAIPAPVDPSSGSTQVATTDDSTTTATPPDLNSARDAVMDAIQAAGVPDGSEPIVALNAQPLGEALHQNDTPVVNGSLPQGLGNPNFNEIAPDSASPSAQPLDMPLPQTLMPPPANPTPPTSSQTNDPTAPPPVPPPMMPPFMNPSGGN